MKKEERRDFIRTYFRYFDRYMKFCLASLPEKKIPVLELDLGKESYTDGERIRIGIGDIKAEDEESLMRWALYLIGHECQHVLSTTQKAWLYGQKQGYHKICERMSAKLEKRPRLFRKEEDYDRFLEDMNKAGYSISPRVLHDFVHFIVNSLEDGRIERLRIAKRPRYKHYVISCRGQLWKENPVDPEMADNLDDPRTYLLVILNQLLTLSTMSLYQKDFVGVCGKDIHIHEVIQNIVPNIKAGVSSNNCRGCMDQGIIICEKLADEIIEASKLTDFEQMLQQLIQKIVEDQSFSADSSTEETSDGIQIAIPVFGTSDMEDAESDMKEDSEDKDSQKDSDEGDEGESEDGEDESEGKNASGDSEDSEDEDSSGDSEGEDSSDDSEDQNDGSKEGEDQESDSKGDEDEDEREFKGSDDPVERMINDEMADAEEGSAAEINTGIASGQVNKRKQPKEDVTGDSGSAKIDKEAVDAAYDHEMNLHERERTYAPQDVLPVEVQSLADIMKRKVERIFRNRKKPSLRGQRKGRIDAGRIYKLPMSQMDIFKQKQIENRFDGCCYILQDNSGSMGNGKRSKRYYCCQAVAVAEHAFQDIMPVKIVAFDAQSENDVTHKVIKNWNEKVTRNAAWNFYKNDSCGYGNKDGYSIRVATQELLMRPEKKKLLFVLSDGLPSWYNGGYVEGCNDVSNAVKEARKRGVEVVSVLFGDDLSEQNEDVQMFLSMYEKNCIISEPDGIMDQLLRVLKRFCFR